MSKPLLRDDSGNLLTFAWPGGYPMFYLTEDNGILCPDCANRKNGSEAFENLLNDPQWNIVAADIHWEGEPLTCDHCNAQIESAYGIPD